jgi:hypothetical protein
MTNKKSKDNDNSKSPSGMTNKKSKDNGNSRGTVVTVPPRFG